MRCKVCTLAVFVLVGCQHQAAPIRNPFLSPDRVPPPATRTPLPGTAQPYYPGDPLPGSTGGAPPTYTPGTTAPVVPTNPAGGWNGQPPAGTASPYNVNPTSAEFSIGSGLRTNEPPVSVNGDDQNLRFAQASQPELVANGAPEYQPQESVIEPGSQQSVVPAPYYAPLSPTNNPEQSAGGFRSPHTSSQFVDQAQYSQAVAPRVSREVAIRPVSTPGSTSTARDGFRPQGSRLIRRDSRSESDSKSIKSASSSSASPEFGPVQEDAQRFGFDPQYQWLRGQLQFMQSSNQWQLRYIPLQGGADQFGGRLLLANPQVLGDLRPGDFVQVRGHMITQQTSAGAMLPLYMVSVVQRQQVQ